ncbi:MAG: hypothetical protein HUK22_08235 [Thermoguttaceae bacterium]|nr:hypothetical protein [Thermoguttaceae bacterium]
MPLFKLSARIRSLALSFCVAAFSSAVAFGQTSSTLDARMMNFLAGKPVASQAATVPTYDEAQNAPSLGDEGVRLVRAAYPASKPEPIRQAQYAAAPTKTATSQLSVVGDPGELDAPYEDVCPDPKDMPSILEIPYKIVPKGTLFPENCPLPEEEYHRKAPTPITFTWKASSLCYKPLYFEEVQLERYGHYCNPCLQPIVSRLVFWAKVPFLPYMMGVNPPNECVYDLGYYRPGNCAPHMLQPIPLSLRGALFEAGAVTGAAAIIP